MRRGTYSIVARDPCTGELGVAVQSHWFSVGPLVPWARPGVGAVATQSIPDPAQGTRALDAMAAAAPAHAALDAVLADDEQIDVRQLALVDARGAVAAHTGAGCIAEAGHEMGPGFSCQANMMERPTVWGAMAGAFAAADPVAVPLAERLVGALEAAEGEGGDVRGRQSAALLVVPARGAAWEVGVSLRVEDHPDPVTELRRLVVLHRAYELADRADALAGAGRPDEAGPLYEQAAALAPESDELLFWAGLAVAQGGDLEGGVARVRQAIGVHAGWRTLLDRLAPEIAPSARGGSRRASAAARRNSCPSAGWLMKRSCACGRRPGTASRSSRCSWSS